LRRRAVGSIIYMGVICFVRFLSIAYQEQSLQK
jgi:hypothetical protein